MCLFGGFQRRRDVEVIVSYISVDKLLGCTGFKPGHVLVQGLHNQLVLSFNCSNILFYFIDSFVNGSVIVRARSLDVVSNSSANSCLDNIYSKSGAT